MNLLLVGEDSPGSLLSSLRPGLSHHSVTVVNPAARVSALVDRPGVLAAASRQRRLRSVGRIFVEAVDQLRPEAVLLIKGRGIAGHHVAEARALGARVVVYYPDNPYWRSGDRPAALDRLYACDLVVVWSERLRHLLSPMCRRVRTVPFGYDDRWFPISPPSSERKGVVFLGTWSPRRQRYLQEIADLGLEVRGWRWQERSQMASGGPSYEAAGGALLQEALIGVNLLHPQCAGAHNMRTREIAASGALLLTDPGLDGTPLRDGDSCVWFRSPAELRDRVAAYLEAPQDAAAIARKGQRLVAHETYCQRGAEIAAHIEDVLA